MQKTGTTSLHSFFLNCNLKSTHDAHWWYKSDMKYFNQYDCFTDGFERYKNEVTFPNLKFLEKNFNGCKFILQTRSLRLWLISRLRHGVEVYKNGINTNCFDEKVILTWVHDRNYWHSIVYNHFKNKDNLLVFDIESDNKVKKLCSFLNIQSSKNKFGTHNSKLNYKNNDNEILITNKIDNFLNDYIIKEDHNTKSIARLKNNY